MKTCSKEECMMHILKRKTSTYPNQSLGGGGHTLNDLLNMDWVGPIQAR